jgi:hypothetical protein
MTDRRFSDDEMQRVFAKAAELSTRGLPERTPDEGYSLDALVEIGRQVGLDASVITAAARSLDVISAPTPRMLGVPVGVGRAVQLDRTLSADEWQRLVVQLRERFGAIGTVSERAGLRQWANGNLRVLVEPTGRGDRVRMQTRNAAAQSYLALGAGLAVVVATGAMVAGVTGAIAEPGVLGPLAGLGTMAAASLGAAALRLRGWAEQRARQMQAIAEALIAESPAVD